MNKTKSILDQFESVNLLGTDAARLMSRTETKFILNLPQFESILSELIHDYNILVVSGIRMCRYQNLYFDTKTFDLYRKHINGKLNRHKVRYRNYLESSEAFLEVKFKSNKGRNIKTRIQKNNSPLVLDTESQNFLNQLLPFDSSNLKPTIWVNYNRISLVNKTEKERLTLDMNLEFVNGDFVKKYENLVIAELKQERRKSSPFTNLMKKHQIREVSVSKYCLGIALTNEFVKTNSIKNILKTIATINL